MAKINQNATLYQGDDRTLTFDVSSDITGVTIAWELRKRVGGNAVLTKVGTITNAASGDFSVTLTDTDTADLLGDYFHKAILTDASNNTVTVSLGVLTFKRA